MLKKDKTLRWLLPALIVVFGAGVVRLFQLRFEAGDVYPAYSSYRADPLGTRALYQSLENLNRVTVRRFIQRLEELHDGRDTTLFVFGAYAAEAERSAEEEYKQLEEFMFDGGRIVISFAPSNTKPWAAQREEASEKKKSGGRTERKDGRPDESDKENVKRKKRPFGDDDDLPGLKLISLKERWNVSLGYEDLPKNPEGEYESVIARRQADLDVPESVIWHTALYFDRPGTNWNVIYARDKQPVLIERRFGRGSLVFSADSYFLSNEAMRKERHADLLAWLVGANRVVLFDETHLGVAEDPGIAALIRKYRLHGLVIGLLLLAGLFVWKNTIAFVPPYDEASAGPGGDAVAGKDSAAGFVNLLRRSIAAADLLPVCFAEWKKGRRPGGADLDQKTERVAVLLKEEQAKPARERDPAGSYRRISRILAERK